MMKRSINKLRDRSLLALTVTLLLSACGSGSDDQTGTDQLTDQVEDITAAETAEQPAIGAATAADFTAIRVEAENFSASTGGWTLTDHQNIPNILPDPDPPHHGNASGFANMELLPDRRVTHDDENIGGVTFWGASGTGPRLEYTLDIPEPGRYMVWVKAFSTGTEDNGIHVGLNGDATPTGERIQWCGGKNNWTWSSAQRVDENHCGFTKTIFLEIDSAGNNNIVFYAREDGFEIDQFMLVKDNSGGSTDCEPQANDQLRCTTNGQHSGTYNVPISSTINGNTVSAPPANLIDIDMDLDLTADRQAALTGDSVEYTVKLSNNDTTYAATNVNVQVNFDNLLAFNSSADCTSTGATTLQCSPSEIAAGNSTTVKFKLTVNGEGSPRVDAQVSLDQTDSNPGNNAESQSITSSPAIPDFDGTLGQLASPNAIGLVDTGTGTLTVNNIGLQTISGATLQIQADGMVAIASNSSACVDSAPVLCNLQDIEPGETVLLPFTVVPQAAGSAAITSVLSVAGDEDPANNTVTSTVLVKDEPIASIANNDVAIEAESFYSQALQASSENGVQLGWSIDNGSVSPAINPDSDQGDHSTASLSSYVEFLPDNRASIQDPLIGGASNFALGGESSTLEYRVFIDKVGQYYVNARIRANDSEDATIHVGLNGVWPVSAASITVCNPDGDWQWTNNQQLDSCDTGAHATLDVTTPGIHSITISTGTDGVEVDKLILRLDDPSLPSGVSTDQQTFTFPDLDLAVDGSIERLRPATEDKARTFELRVHNLDETAEAYDISVMIEGLDATIAPEILGFESCQAIEESIECKIHSIPAAGVAVASVNIDDMDREIVSTVSVAAANDTDPANNSVVTTYGGGTLSLSFLLLLMLTCLSSIRRESSAQPRTILAANH